MKAVRIHAYGGSENLKYEDIVKSVNNEDQLLIKINAASVNHLEIKKAGGMMKDLNFPWIPGYDFAGVVESVGDNITEFKKGDEVYGNSNGGTYAEYLASSAKTVVKKPENLSFSEAACVPHVGETAWQAVHTHGKLVKGQKVLIHGAAGAVGAYAVQFAHIADAVIYATASAHDKDYVKKLGADNVIDYVNEDFTTIAKDMDLIIDLVGGDTQLKSYRIVKKGGRLVSTVGIVSEEEGKKYNITLVPMVIKQSGEDLKIITGLINEGKIKIDVAMILPLKKAGEAWNILQRKGKDLPRISHGKIVLDVATK